MPQYKRKATFQYVEPKPTPYHSFIDFLDYDVSGLGFIIPQQVYVHRCHITGALGQEPWKKHKPPSIDFGVQGRQLGISLKDALNTSFLYNESLHLVPAPEAYRTDTQLYNLTFGMRILWPGYMPYSSDTNMALRKLHTADDLKQLLAMIARIVTRFLNKPTQRVEGDWNGWNNLEKFRDNLDKLYILRLVSVAARQWQPVLAVSDEMFMA